MTGLAVDPARSLYDDAPCGLVTLDADGLVREVNATMAGWTGRDRADLLATPFVELLPTADQLLYETRLAPLLHLSGELREVALTMRTATGSMPILFAARSVGNQVRIAIFDASERHGYERALLAAQRVAEASESRVRTLQQAATAFATSSSETQLADRLVEIIRPAMASVASSVVLFDEAGTTTLVAGEYPLSGRDADPAVRSEVVALRDAGVVNVGSLTELQARYPGLVDGFVDARIEAFSLVPIEDVDGVIGALMCFFGRAGTLSEDDIALQLAVARQAAQVLARIRLQEELRAFALHDQLTGVANRRLLHEHLIRRMAAAQRHHLSISLLLLDIDEFKSVNDERGHQAGDEVLVWAVQKMLASVRADDIVGRYGGDEFVIICHDADETVARDVSERIRAEIAASPESLPGGQPLTVSIGIAVCPPGRDPRTPAEFFAVADRALYRSKRAGKNRVSAGDL